MSRITGIVKNKIALYANANYHRDRSMMVFGAWMGQKFADNPKYLYLEAIKQKEIKSLWITKNPEVYVELKSKGLPVEMADSERGIKFQKEAMYFVICTGIKDINQDYLGGAVIVNLWHGVPLKKVMWEDNINQKFNWLTYHLKTMVDYIPLHKYYILSTSKEMKRIIMRSFKKNEKWVPILGQVRNDLFFSDEFLEDIDLSKFQGRKIITYMPTHRNEGKTYMYMENLLDLNRIEYLCQKYNYIFIIKKHFYHQNESANYADEYEHIFDITQKAIDSQELMKYSDVLITDYSSCYIDYLLLDRPILFYSFDLKQYLEVDRGMNFSYKDAVAGPIIQNKEVLSDEIEKIMIGIDEHRNKRIITKEIFYDESASGYSGDKVLDFIKSL